MATPTAPGQDLTALAEGDRPVLETLTRMTVDTCERSGLSPQDYALVRIAALVALDGPPMSYLLNVGAATELGVTMEQVRGVLVAIAPVVGTAKVVSAAGNLVSGLGLAETILDGDA